MQLSYLLEKKLIKFFQIFSSSSHVGINLSVNDFTSKCTNEESLMSFSQLTEFLFSDNPGIDVTFKYRLDCFTFFMVQQ